MSYSDRPWVAMVPGYAEGGGLAVIFNVYTRPDGAYLLVPDCMLTPLEAEATHGPLTFCETIDSDRYPVPALWERVMDEIDQMSFAVLQATVGRQMLDLDCKDRQDRPAGLDTGIAGPQFA